MTIRKKPLKQIKTTIEEMVDHVLAGTGARPTVVISPVVWQPKDDGVMELRKTPAPASWLGPVIALEVGPARRWYFAVAAGDHGNSHFEIDQIVGTDREDTIAIRERLMARLVQHHIPIVLLAFESELEMARCCEAVWPSAKATEIRQGIEREDQIGIDLFE